MRSAAGRSHRRGLPEEIVDALDHLPVVGSVCRRARNENQILSGENREEPVADGLTEEAFDTIANCCLSNALADGEADSRVRIAGGKYIEHAYGCAGRPSQSARSREVARTAKTILFGQHRMLPKPSSGDAP